MYLALDIGGANLKASDGDAASRSLSFPIWKHPDRLAEALQELLTAWSDWSGLAVTMTAELADCFATKAEGVRSILAAVEEVAGDRPVQVWQTGGEFVTSADARDLPRLVAAANWHALATWGGRMAPAGSALLVDVGSTTTDLIPIVDGLPEPQGRTDVERLLSGELLYVGVRRTPLCAVAPQVSFRGGNCPLAAELFATTLDVRLLTGDVPEDLANCDTADGRPATRAAAHSRLAHLLCCDVTELSETEAVSIARELRGRLAASIRRGLERVTQALPAACRTILLSGEGELLAAEVLRDVPALRGAEVLSLTGLLGPEHSQSACAFALARLAQERLR